jgi:hypothetical protein
MSGYCPVQPRPLRAHDWQSVVQHWSFCCVVTGLVHGPKIVDVMKLGVCLILRPSCVPE